MANRIMKWITVVINKFYRAFDITKIQEDISDFLTALRSRLVNILLLFLPLYSAEITNVIELFSPII